MHSVLSLCSVKLLNLGDVSYKTEAEVASSRSTFTQEIAIWHKIEHANVTKKTYRS